MISETLIDKEVDDREFIEKREVRAEILQDWSSEREALGSFERSEELSRQWDSNPFN